MFNKKPSVKYLRLFGSTTFVRVPEEKRASKWDRKADKGILLGYTEVCYRVLVNGKVITARHVDIIEENVQCISFKEESDSDDDLKPDKENKKDQSRANKERNENSSEEKSEKPVRERKKPVRYDENYVYHCAYVNYCNDNIPDTYENAIKSNEADKWKEAMMKEFNSLNKNDTWSLVNKPVDKEILDVKWIYTKKAENNFKARLVVRGFQQTELTEETYSPVTKMETLKMLLSYCCQNGLDIHQMDVDTGFLNGKINSEVYVNQPPGFGKVEGKVYRLKKALYGLKESPRVWYDCFDDHLISLGFERCLIENCLYVLKNQKGKVVYIIIFVDDLLVCSENVSCINDVKNKLKAKFHMKDLGRIKRYLGIDVNYNLYTQVMTLSQSEYIESLAHKYGIENSKLYKTPMEENLKLEPAAECENLSYRNLIGALLYVSCATRPDIAFSVNYLSRFMTTYDQPHFKYALRVLKYLFLTKDMKLVYEKSAR